MFALLTGVVFLCFIGVILLGLCRLLTILLRWDKGLLRVISSAFGSFDRRILMYGMISF